MALSFFDEEIKNALRANRKDVRSGNRADKMPISKRIEMLEDKLVKRVLSFGEITDIQAELKVLRKRL